MDFDGNLFLNFIPVISATVLTLIISVTVFYTLKNRFVRINCWFCNGNAKVERKSLDWWLCPHCKQYNGFTEDGDYNYEIPEQHKIAKKKISDKSYCERKEFSMSHNSLCKECNKKEELKLLKLREFENSMDVYNDKKISRFEKTFEKKYPLCLKCQSIVQTVLHKQAIWLTQYKMLFFKQKPIRRIIENREKIERVLRIILSILPSVAIYFTEVWYLPLCGVLFQLATYLACSVGRRHSDIFSILGWTCLVWVNTFSTTEFLKIFKIYSNNDYISINDNTYQYFIVTLGVVIGLTNLKYQTHNTISNTSLSFKKLESSNNTFSVSRSPSPNITTRTTTVPTEETICNQEPSRNLYSPVNITDSLMTPTAVETPIPLKPNSVPQRSFEENKNCAFKSFSSTTNFSPTTENLFFKNSNEQSYLNDSLSSLNSLSLGTHQKTLSPHSPKVFETKVYGTTSPDLFTKNQRSNQKRPILAPPKLRSVTQTSWVAGGYWQSGMEVPTLSRSSSQSSGFGSSGSNYGPSREPSVHEFDQYSITSDQCYFARPESPLSTRNSTILKKKSNNYTPRCVETNDMSCGTESLQYHIKNDTQCSGHTTIVTNPIWLPALLCGSLVFNMVVLCTILLR